MSILRNTIFVIHGGLELAHLHDHGIGASSLKLNSRRALADPVNPPTHTSWSRWDNFLWRSRACVCGASLREPSNERRVRFANGADVSEIPAVPRRRGGSTRRTKSRGPGNRSRSAPPRVEEDSEVQKAIRDFGF